eukprot:GHRQ01039849.1.p1 GENE.GHRQ01039849.1~~GHRQ01039849.1.p1  ORF type:complete len:134 (-),score=18.81 GHRQ01039849.1:311-712(-)
MPSRVAACWHFAVPPGAWQAAVTTSSSPTRCSAAVTRCQCLALRLQAALRAREAGSTRFCMGAAWRGPSQVGPRQWERVLEMVRRIRGLGMEVSRLLLLTAWLLCWLQQQRHSCASRSVGKGFHGKSMSWAWR